MTVRELGKMSALALGVVLVLAACSDGTSRDERIGQLEEDAGLTEEQATCVVDALVDEYGEDILDEDDPADVVGSDQLAELTLGCLGTDLPEEVRAEGIAAFMEAVPGVTEEQASCMVDGLVDELGADGVAALADPASLDDRTTELITELTSTCGLGADTLGGR